MTNGLFYAHSGLRYLILLLGLAAAVAIDLANGGAMMRGAGLLLVPGTAVFMLVVGLPAAAGPARRRLSVHPPEALRAG